jgi:hypothetical protein
VCQKYAWCQWFQITPIGSAVKNKEITVAKEELVTLPALNSLQNGALEKPLFKAKYQVTI